MGLVNKGLRVIEIFCSFITYVKRKCLRYIKRLLFGLIIFSFSVMNIKPRSLRNKSSRLRATQACKLPLWSYAASYNRTLLLDPFVTQANRMLPYLKDIVFGPNTTVQFGITKVSIFKQKKKS